MMQAELGEVKALKESLPPRLADKIKVEKDYESKALAIDVVGIDQRWQTAPPTD